LKQYLSAQEWFPAMDEWVTHIFCHSSWI
jgi:hypothetical protein